MGSYQIINDTLEITTQQGFPADELLLELHREAPYTAEDFEGRVFSFHDKLGPRRYHTPPIRNFLVHNIDGKWLYWGKIIITRQTVDGENEEELTTSGRFKITEIFDPEYQEQFTKRESPKGLSYF